MNYLLHFGDIPDETLIVHKLGETLQLVEVTDEVLTDFLSSKIKNVHKRNFPVPLV